MGVRGSSTSRMTESVVPVAGDGKKPDESPGGTDDVLRLVPSHSGGKLHSMQADQPQ